MAHVGVNQPIVPGLNESPQRQDRLIQIWRSKRVLSETISPQGIIEGKPLTSLRPAVLISLSKSAHSSTCVPAMPVRAYEHSRTLPHRRRYVPLYSIGMSGCPPNVIIFVWCRSNMRVVNVAHVDAQNPLPTGI
jgi:hypothetical protein